MDFMNWEVSFRPFVLLRNCFFVTLMACGVFFPRSEVAIENVWVPMSPQEVAKGNAYRVIDQMLARRMLDFDAVRRHDLAVTIVDQSAAAGFDPLFVMAVIDAESRFDHEAVSPTGARGLMQILRSTFAQQVKDDKLPSMDAFNPNHNVTVGIAYLRQLAKSFKRPESVALAYNQGPHAASEILAGREEPTPEAAGYGPIVMYRYSIMLSEAGFDPQMARKLWKSPELTLLRPPTGHGVPEQARQHWAPPVICQSVQPKPADLVTKKMLFELIPGLQPTAIYSSYEVSKDAADRTTFERCGGLEPFRLYRHRRIDGRWLRVYLPATCRRVSRARLETIGAAVHPRGGIDSNRDLAINRQRCDCGGECEPALCGRPLYLVV